MRRLKAPWLLVGTGPSFRFVPGYENVVCLNRAPQLWPEPCWAAMGATGMLRALEPIVHRLKGVVIQAYHGQKTWEAALDGPGKALRQCNWDPFAGIPVVYIPFVSLPEDDAGTDWMLEGIRIVRGNCLEIALHWLHMHGIRRVDTIGIDGGKGHATPFNMVQEYGGADYQSEAQLAQNYDFAVSHLQSMAAALHMDVRRLQLCEECAAATRAECRVCGGDGVVVPCGDTDPDGGFV